MGRRRSEWQSKSFLKAFHFILPTPAFFRSSSFLHLPLMTNLKRRVTWYEGKKRWKDKEKSLQRQKKRRVGWENPLFILQSRRSVNPRWQFTDSTLALFLTLLHFNTPEDDLPPSSHPLKHWMLSANKFTSGFRSRCGASTNTSFITSYFKSRHTLAPLQQITSCIESRGSSAPISHHTNCLLTLLFTSYHNTAITPYHDMLSPDIPWAAI